MTEEDMIKWEETVSTETLSTVFSSSFSKLKQNPTKQSTDSLPLQQHQTNIIIFYISPFSDYDHFTSKVQF